MLNYESRPGALPHTGARYKYDRKLNVVNDVLTGQVIKAKEDGTFDIGSKLYPNDLTEAELYLLTHKPLYLNQKDFFDNFRTPNIQVITTPNSTIGRRTAFWKLNVECVNYPGFYYIPGFTQYVINRKGTLISLIKGIKLTQSVSSVGYLTSRINRDDGKTHYAQIHNLLGLVFKDWDHEIIDMVIDHLDGNKLNLDLTNLEWTSFSENVRRANKMGLSGKGTSNPLYCYDVQDNIAYTFYSQADATRELNLKKGSLQAHLQKQDKNGLLYGRYFIVYREVDEQGNFIDGYDQDDPTGNKLVDTMEFRTREGSQPKAVLVKNVSNGIITKFTSVVNFIKDSGLTRKQVYPRLRDKRQKKYGDIIFKYEDDDTDWIL